MTLITAKPVRNRKTAYYNMDRLLEDLFRFNPGTRNNRNGQPAVNIVERAQDWQLEFAVPGWNKSDFKVEIEKDILTVTAERQEKEQADTNEPIDMIYRRREFGASSFKRSFRIPETVETKSIEAKYIDGILTLTLPKQEEAKSDLVRRIDIS